MTGSRITSLNTQKPEQLKIQSLKKPKRTNWLEFINDDRTKLAIPVGARFQADVPDWPHPPSNKCPSNGDNESDTSRWLGAKVWPIKAISLEAEKDVNGKCRLESRIEVIGKGRPDFCSCESPGSVECVKRHLSYKRIQLQSQLGPAFWRWGFNEIGEAASDSWNFEEEKEFETIVKANPISEGKSFLMPALKCLTCQNRETIVRYYFNVYLPRRISKRVRSGCTTFDTDDEDEETLAFKASRKRCQADSVTSYSYNPKYVKTRYLEGRR